MLRAAAQAEAPPGPLRNGSRAIRRASSFLSTPPPPDDPPAASLSRRMSGVFDETGQQQQQADRRLSDELRISPRMHPPAHGGPPTVPEDAPMSSGGSKALPDVGPLVAAEEDPFRGTLFATFALDLGQSLACIVYFVAVANEASPRDGLLACCLVALPLLSLVTMAPALLLLLTASGTSGPLRGLAYGFEILKVCAALVQLACVAYFGHSATRLPAIPLLVACAVWQLAFRVVLGFFRWQRTMAAAATAAPRAHSPIMARHLFPPASEKRVRRLSRRRTSEAL
jgi:hypothetical protein